jgi:Notch-like protein
VSVHAYQCTCADGYANGWCEYDYISQYTAQCTVFESDDGASLGGNCDADVDECASNPCQNNGICHDHPSEWVCDCAHIVTTRAGTGRGWEGEDCTTAINMCTKEEGDCDPINAVCSHLGPGHHDCTCNLGWAGDGTTCTDVDECAGNACGQTSPKYRNDAAEDICVESNCGVSKWPDGKACSTSAVVLGNGTSIPRPATDTYVCLDADECASSPCKNGAACTDSLTDATLYWKAYRCTCAAGYANGMCDYHYIYIPELTQQCTVSEGGNCDVDVDECVSHPCTNGATCSDSTSASAAVAAAAG